jgi:hypothetical protein
MGRLIGCAAVAVVVVCGLAACSSSKSKTNVSTATTTASAAASQASGSSSGGSSSGGKFCTDAATNNLAQELQANAAANPANGTAVAQKDLADLKRYESEAPSAIKGDITTLVNFYDKYVNALTNDQGNLTKLASDMQGLQSDQAGLTAAVQHVEAYYTANCHA